jgi:hypothetical protein
MMNAECGMMNRKTIGFLFIIPHSVFRIAFRRDLEYKWALARHFKTSNSSRFW